MSTNALNEANAQLVQLQSQIMECTPAYLAFLDRHCSIKSCAGRWSAGDWAVAAKKQMDHKLAMSNHAVENMSSLNDSASHHEVMQHIEKLDDLMARYKPHNETLTRIINQQRLMDTNWVWSQDLNRVVPDIELTAENFVLYMELRRALDQTHTQYVAVEKELRSQTADYEVLEPWSLLCLPGKSQSEWKKWAVNLLESIEAKLEGCGQALQKVLNSHGNPTDITLKQQLSVEALKNKYKPLTKTLVRIRKVMPLENDYASAPDPTKPTKVCEERHRPRLMLEPIPFRRQMHPIDTKQTFTNADTGHITEKLQKVEQAATKVIMEALEHYNNLHQKLLSWKLDYASYLNAKKRQNASTATSGAQRKLDEEARMLLDDTLEGLRIARANFRAVMETSNRVHHKRAGVLRGLLQKKWDDMHAEMKPQFEHDKQLIEKLLKLEPWE